MYAITSWLFSNNGGGAANLAREQLSCWRGGMNGHLASWHCWRTVHGEMASLKHDALHDDTLCMNSLKACTPPWAFTPGIIMVMSGPSAAVAVAHGRVLVDVKDAVTTASDAMAATSRPTGSHVAHRLRGCLVASASRSCWCESSCTSCWGRCTCAMTPNCLSIPRHCNPWCTRGVDEWRWRMSVLRWCGKEEVAVAMHCSDLNVTTTHLGNKTYIRHRNTYMG
jgi:hypothetical protein